MSWSIEYDFDYFIVENVFCLCCFRKDFFPRTAATELQYREREGETETTNEEAKKIANVDWLIGDKFAANIVRIVNRIDSCVCNRIRFHSETKNGEMHEHTLLHSEIGIALIHPVSHTFITNRYKLHSLFVVDNISGIFFFQILVRSNVVIQFGISFS